MYLVWQTIRFILVDLLWQAVYFPLWWYGQGAWHILKIIGANIKEFAHSLNLKILFKHLFKPMYGLGDIWSRIISFFVRIVYFFILLGITLAWIFVLFVLFLLWLLVPIFILYNILFQLNLIGFNIYGYFI